MNEEIVNVKAFAPFQGGKGKRFSVTTATSSVAIPGLAGGQPAPMARVLVSNGSTDTSAFIRLGDQTVVADTDCMEILAGCAYMLTPPFAGPGGIWLAAITEVGATKISVLYGEGS